MHDAKVPGQANIAVLGAGLIGLDLVEKIQRSTALHCALVAGRDEQTLGLRRAADLGCATTAGGITSLMEAGPFDIVCDASNADAHPEHWARLRETGALLIDLTPSSLGTMAVPTVNGADALASRNISLITCGGQAAIPILHALAQDCVPAYVEVVCSGASASAGRATRLNLDHYIDTTQAAIRAFTGAQEVKVMLNLSPADPPPPFRVTMTMLPIRPGAGLATEAVGPIVEAVARDVRAFAPGFAVTSCQASTDQVRVCVEVTADGGRIPRYAGNLDIINAAAVLLAERYAARPPSAGLAGRKDSSWITC